jgi:O-antigen ligase
MPPVLPAASRVWPVPRPVPGARPASFPARPEAIPGFFLFIILNASLFIRPAEIIPGLPGHIYLFLILPCLVVGLPGILQHLSGAPLSTRPITLCVLGLLAAVVLSHVGRFTLSESALENITEFAKVVAYFLLLAAFVTTPGRLRFFLYCFAAFSAVLTLLAVLNYHGVIEVVNLSAVKEAQQDVVNNRLEVIQRLRGTGVFNDPNDLCLVLVVGVVISLYGLADRRLGLARLFWLAALGLFLYALSLTGSRGGFLALLVGLMIFGTERFGKGRSVVLAAVLLPVLFGLFAGRQTELSTTGNTGQTRIQIWNDGIVMFKGSPLLGIGCGEYEKDAGLVAHNTFLHSFAELGVIGGVLFLGAFYSAFWSLRRLGSGPTQILDPELRRLRPYLVGLVAAYSTGMLTLSVGYIVPTYTVLGLAAVYLQMVVTSPPVPPLRFDGQLLKRMLLMSVIFLAVLFVFVRLFVRW